MAWLLAFVLAATVLSQSLTALAQSEVPPEPASDPALAEARAHFEIGVTHFDRREWQAALVEFLKSRQLAKTKANTKNAAICLRKVGRFDEALDLFEALVHDFPDLPSAERELAEREISELTLSVGTLEILAAPPGARVSIDSVDSGVTPLSGPVRLPAGTHTVRVVKDGSLPFEARIDLAGGQAKILRAPLAALPQAGRLRVTEFNGRATQVVLDGANAGTTPWEGALAPGAHTLLLRGEGTLGTPPSEVTVKLDQLTSAELIALPLRSVLRVEAEPASAEIYVDGVLVGRGSWEGRLHSGAHRLVAALDAYAPFTRLLTLREDERAVVPALLEPASAKPGILMELSAGVPMALLWGGELRSTCTNPCSSALGLGGQGEVHATYRFVSGVGVGIHAGYLALQLALEHRLESLHPVGRPPSQGTVDDHLRLAGLMAGAEAEYVKGTRWPLTIRLGMGALIGSVRDARVGTFADSLGVQYRLDASQSPRATYFYVDPELRVGRKLGAHFELDLGLKVLVLAALGMPAWSGLETPVAAGNDGLGYFSNTDLSGRLLLSVAPELAAKYAF